MAMSSTASLPVPLAIAIVLMCMIVALYLGRALGRRRRRRDRGDARSLVRLMRGTLRGRPWAERLKRTASRATPEAFWVALERLALGPERRALRHLADSFDGLAHVRLERRCLREDSPWRRELAARRLALVPSAASVKALRRALRRGPEPVSLAAAHALARARDRAALRWLLANPQVIERRSRRQMASLLSAYGRHGLAEIASAFERGIEHPVLELAAMDTLGAGGYRGARDRLERALASGNLEQRIASARALGRLEAVECATSLLAALRDEAWQVRAQAARSLGSVRATIAITALAARLTDRSWWVRRHAAYALGSLGVDGRETLRRIAASSPDPYARDMAQEVLEGGVDLHVA